MPGSFAVNETLIVLGVFVRHLNRTVHCMAKTRIAPRHRTSKAARIEFSGGRPIDCMVRDLSLTGAKIQVSSQHGIPKCFVLAIPEDGLRLPSRIAWRKDFHLGVVFE
jgi:PilZ domain